MNRLYFFIGILICNSFVSAQVGKKFPSERKEYKDSVTGRNVIVLTTHPGSDTKIYQTHPQWTSDGEWIIFRSTRSEGRGQAFAVNEKKGEGFL